MGLALPAPAYNAQQWHRHHAATHTLHHHTTPPAKKALPQPAATKALGNPMANPTALAAVAPLEELPLEDVLNQRYTPESGQEPNSPFKQAMQALAATLFVAAAAWAILRHPRTHKVLLWVGQLLAQWGFKVQVPPATPVVAAAPTPACLRFTPFTVPPAEEAPPVPPAQWEPPTPNPVVATPVTTTTVTPAAVETVLPPAPITPFSATGPSFRVLASQALPLNGFLHQVQVEDTLLLVAQSAQGFTLLHHQPLHAHTAPLAEANDTLSDTAAPRLLANPVAAVAAYPADEDSPTALDDAYAEEEALPCPSQEASAFWEAVAGR
jgi:flagellar biogenesis protein FliO